MRSHSSRAGNPSSLNPVSREIISDSVELWETEVCFTHIQLIGTNVWLPTMHNVPPDVDFESSRSPAKVGVLKQSQTCIVLQCYPHNNTVYIHMCDECRISSDSGVLSHTLVHFVIDLAKLFTVPQDIGSSQFVPSINFLETILRACIWQFSNIFHFFFFWCGGSSLHGRDTLWELVSRFVG